MDNKPHILIGNGINSAFNEIVSNDSDNIKQRFTYEEISNFKISDTDQTICEKYNTSETDIEKILYKMESEKDKCNLKKDFIQILGNMHHGLYSDLTKFINNKEDIVRNNLNNFEAIYTINFDLKLYYLMRILGFLNQRDFEDKFSIDKPDKPDTLGHLLRYNPGCKTTYIYLHGAMHLLECNGDCYKVVSNRSNGKNLRDKTSKIATIEGFNRLLVIGARAAEKLNYIRSSRYLKENFNNLKKTINNELIIYGCSMGNNDRHIWNAINKSDNKNNIYIGTCLGNRDELDRIQRLFDKKLNNLQFFCQKQFNIWSCKDWLTNIKNNSFSLQEKSL